jgi:alpha-beta hydrolase superfamily lysophospholipase
LENGYGLYMLSYRGHYKSGGVASEKGVYKDAQAAIEQLTKKGIRKKDIVLWGHSLGTVVAVETALNNRVAGVILQCPIKDLKSAAIDVYKFYCNRLHLGFLAKLAAHHIKRMKLISKMNNINKISRIKCPILIMHSKSDRITPYENSVELSKMAKNSHLVISERGSHWDVNWCFKSAFEFVKSLEYNDKVKNT